MFTVEDDQFETETCVLFWSLNLDQRQKNLIPLIRTYSPLCVPWPSKESSVTCLTYPSPVDIEAGLLTNGRIQLNGLREKLEIYPVNIQVICNAQNLIEM